MRRRGEVGMQYPPFTLYANYYMLRRWSRSKGEGRGRRTEVELSNLY